MFWFNRKDPRALFIDNRRATYVVDVGTPGTKGRRPIVVDPDQIADFTALPFPDGSFSLVVFDPPHIIEPARRSARGVLVNKYGFLRGDWRAVLRQGFAECFRILRPSGVLIFKWADVDRPLKAVLDLIEQRPLFGHPSGKRSRTHWCAFLKE